MWLVRAMTLVVDVGSSADGPAAQAAASKVAGAVAEVAKADAQLAGVDGKKYPKLPEATSSFGGVGLDGYLYVYGGHIAPTHHYDKLAVSGKFNRLKLDGGTPWQTLESGPALQGMNRLSTVKTAPIAAIQGSTFHSVWKKCCAAS